MLIRMYYIRTTSTSCPSWPPWPWEPEASCALGGAMAPGCPLGHHSKAKEAVRLRQARSETKAMQARLEKAKALLKEALSLLD